MTVEFTLLDYLTYIILAYVFGIGTGLLGVFVYSEAKRTILREAKKEAREQR